MYPTRLILLALAAALGLAACGSGEDASQSAPQLPTADEIGVPARPPAGPSEQVVRSAPGGEPAADQLAVPAAAGIEVDMAAAARQATAAAFASGERSRALVTRAQHYLDNQDLASARGILDRLKPVEALIPEAQQAEIQALRQRVDALSRDGSAARRPAADAGG